MSDATPGAPQPADNPRSYRMLSGIADSNAAIDEVIATAQRTLCIFDFTLMNRGFNSPSRFVTMRKFLVAGRAHRILIALHEPDLLERECPRLLMLLRQFPMSIAIHRTVSMARSAMDPFVLADDRSVWHQMHYSQLRAIVALHSPVDAVPIVQRFNEIWDQSEPAISATTTGL